MVMEALHILVWGNILHINISHVSGKKEEGHSLMSVDIGRQINCRKFKFASEFKLMASRNKFLNLASSPN
jgi:hypothetical protein